MNCPECGTELKGELRFCDACGARLKQSHPSFFGRYRVLREVGRGAIGVVYLARDDKIGRNVAIKALDIDHRLPGDQKKEIKNRFEREARAAGMLSQENIVTIYDVGEQDGVPYIAMEYLEGTTLTELSHDSPLTIHQAKSVIVQVLAALSYAHSHDVVHRDIKPDNIFLLPDGRVKVADFGIARLASSSTMTRVGQVMGTPGYMSPEQVKGEVVGPQSDIFSTGVLLYELLTGTAPFASTSPTSIMYKIVHEEPRAPHLINPGVPPNLEAVIARATAKNLAARYESASSMREDLKSGATPLTTEVPSNEGTMLRAAPLEQVMTLGAPAPCPAPVPLRKKKHVALWVGTGAGALLVVIAIVVVIVLALMNDKPSVKITEPTDGAHVSNPMKISLDVRQFPAGGKVTVYVDDKEAKVLDAAPFETDVDSGDAGKHILRVTVHNPGGVVLADAATGYTSKGGGDSSGGEQAKAEITSIIQQWKTTEENHDFNPYIALYSRSFNSGPVNKDTYRNKSYDEWVQLRSNQFATPGRPTSTIENPRIIVSGEKAVAEFQSTFNSGSFSSYGTNRLEFAKENGIWMIISEQWCSGATPPAPFMVPMI